MKVLRDGKEIKNAKVAYFENGVPHVVEVDGINYDPSVFTFEEEKGAKKTRTTSDGNAMTTKSVPTKKKK